MVISAYLGVAGLVDVGYRYYTNAEVAVAARVTAGISDAGNGWYSADVTLPGTAASVRWDSTGTPTAIAREYFDTLEASNFTTVNTKLDTIDDFLDTEIAAIQTKVNALPSDPADASDIAASFATVNGTLATLSGYVDTEVAAILAAVDTEVAAIKAKTDNLPTDPADESNIAANFATLSGKVDVIDDFLDTEIAAIKAVTDKLNTALVIDGAVYQYTANALELGPVSGGGGGDAQQATLLAVKAKTDALPTDPADASDVAAQITVTNGKVDTVIAKTNNLPIDPADASDIAASFVTVNTKLDSITTGLPLDATELNAIADALLKRDWTAVSGEAAYSMLNACRMLRNVWSSTTGSIVVKKEDGTTTAWSRTLTVDPTAQPITGAT